MRGNWQKKLAKEVIQHMEGKTLDDIDQELLKIQRSTRTSSRLLTPIHDKLRLKYSWYYRWHMNPLSKFIHGISLTAYILAVGLFAVNFINGPYVQYSQAASTATLTPSGAGYSASANFGGAATPWQAVLTNDGATSYIGSGPSSSTYGFTFANPNVPAGATIQNVTVYAVAINAGGTLNMLVYTTANTTAYLSGNITPAATYTQYSNAWTTNPATSAAWTPAVVNSGLQIGVKLSRVSAACQATQVWAVVNYTVPTVPNTPSVSSPANAAIDVAVNPTVTSSAYSGTGSHASSSWEIYDNSGLAAGNLVWSKSADAVNLTSIVVNSTNGTFANALSGQTALAKGTNYWVRARHTNENGDSAWSTANSFTSFSDAPTISSPANAATGVNANPTITSSAYAGSGAHASSTWEIYDNAGLAAGNLVWSKASDATNLTSIVVNESNGTFANALSGQTTLHEGTSYWVRAKYTDEFGDTVWSSANQFTTEWTTLNLSGTVYTADNKSTNVGSGKTVALSVNGGVPVTVTTGTGGTFTFNTISGTTDDKYLLYLSGNTEKGNLVSQFSAATGMFTVEMYTNKVVVSHDSAGPMTNALLASAYRSDSDIFYSVTDSNAAFNSSYELFIPTGKNYTPGGTVTVGGLQVSGTGTFSPGVNDVTVSGNWIVPTTGFFTSTGTVTFSAASGTQTLAAGGADANHQFANLTKSNGGTLQLTTSATKVATTLTISASTILNLNGQGLTAGTLVNNNWLKLTGDEAVTITNFDSTHGTVEYVATSGSRSIKNFTYNNLKINGTGGTFNLPAAITVNGNLDVAAGTLNTSDGTARSLTVTGNVTIAGTMTANSSTITVSGNWDSSVGTFTYGTSTVVFNNTNTITTKTDGSWPTNFYNLTMAAAGKTNTFTYLVTVGNVCTLGTGTIVSDSLSWLALRMNGGTPLVNAGATINTSRVVYVPTSGTDVVAAGNYGSAILEFFNSSGTNAVTFNQAGAITAGDMELVSHPSNTITYNTQGNALTVNSIGIGDSNYTGNVTMNMGASTVNIGTGGIAVGNNGGSGHTVALGTSTMGDSGDWKLLNGTGSANMTYSSGQTVTFNGDGTQVLTSNNKNFYNVVHSGAGTLQLATSNLTTANNFTNSGGIFDANSLNVTVGGALANSATLTMGSGAWTVTGNTTFSAGTVNANSATITESGNFTISGGTFEKGTSTLVMKGTGSLSTGGQELNNLKVSQANAGATHTSAFTSSQTWTVPSDWNASNNTISAIGPGGHGYVSKAGGGGGAFNKITNWNGSGNISLTIPAGGAMAATIFKDATTLKADYGRTPTTITGGAGGAIANNYPANTGYAGGHGGNNGANTYGGGGGAAGPNGPGGNGGNGGSVGVGNPGGGGGADGGTNGGSSGVSGVPGTAGIGANGGGNGGSLSAGLPGAEWTYTMLNGSVASGTIGAGGGASGSSGGGNYGSGGSASASGGTGGLIVITYTVAAVNSSITVSDDIVVAGTLTTDASQTLTIASGKTITMSAGSTTTNNGTISGSGKLDLVNTAGASLSTGGTLSSAVRFTTASDNVTIPARTYGGNVEVYNDSASNYTATLGTASSQTLTFSGNFTPIANSTGNITIAANTYNPTVNITGSISYTKASSGIPSINGGNGTWNIGGNLDFSNGGFTSGTGTLNFNSSSAGQTITTAGQTLYNLTSANSHSSGLTFADSATVSGTFTDTTGGSHLTFNAGSTFAFAIININGAGNDIIMHSSADGSPWLFNVSAAAPTVTDADVKDSNASGGSAIHVVSCVDNGGNSNWIFNQSPNAPSSLGPVAYIDGTWQFDITPTLTFDISDPEGTDTLKFEIKISTNSDFSSPVVDYSSALDTQGSKSFTVGQATGSGTYAAGSEGQTLSDGSYYWGVKATDNSNASSGWSSAGQGNTVDIKIDTALPTTDIYLNPVDPNGINSYYKSSAPAVSFTSDDASGSGASTVYYKWGSGEYQAYSGSPINAPEGTNTIYYYGTDIAGNTGSASPISRQVKVDSVTPSVTATASPVGPNGSNNYYIGSAPSITLSSSDATSGLASIQYKWDSGSYAAYTAPLTASEGSHTLYYYAVDNAGNSGESSADSTVYNVDLTNPAVSVVSSPLSPNGSNGYYIATAPTITLEASESGSGLSAIKYKWDSDSYVTYTTSLTAPEGTHTLYYYGIDNSGNNSAEDNEVFKVDLTNAGVDIYFNPASPNGSNSWYKNVSPSITFSSSDNGSGADKIYYRWGASGDFSQYSTVINAPEGTNTIYYYATDNAGNQSSTFDREVKLDTIVPLAEAVSSPLVPDGDNSYYVAAPVVTLSGSDIDGSDIASIKYNWDSESYQDYTTPLTASEGTHTLSYFVTDNAGLNSATGSLTIKVDTGAPTEFSPTANPSSWTNSNSLSLSFATTDSGSGIANYKVKVDSGSYSANVTSPYALDISALSDGDHTVTVKATDNAGNYREGTVMVYTDKSAPAIFTPVADPSSWTNSDIELSFESSDATSGITGYQYKIDEGNYSNNIVSPYTLGVANISDGTHTVTIKATDNAGNYREGSTSIYIDKTLPQVSSVLDPASPNGTDSYYKAAPAITISASATSGIAQLKYKWNDGEYLDYITPLTAPEGINSLTYYAIDNAGKNSGEAIRTVRVDTSVPTISSSSVPALPNGTNDYYIGAAPSITLSAEDVDSSGIASIKYKWDSATYATYSTALTAPEGIHTLSYFAIDNAGNSSEPEIIQYKTDTTAPALILVSSPDAANGNNGYYNTAPTVTLIADDTTGSGVNALYYRWGNSGEYSEYLAPFTAPEGINTLYYYATDAAGNGGSGQAGNMEMKVDSVNPLSNAVMTPSDPDESGYFTNNAPVISISGTDIDGSGVDQIKYRWNSESFNNYTNEVTAPEGQNSLSFYSIDLAGNESEIGNLTVNVDTTAPDMSTITPAATTPTNNPEVTFVWGAAAEAGSGVSTYLVDIGTTAGGHDVVNGAETTVPSYKTTFSSDGTYYATVRATDNVGHLGSWSKSGSVVIDRTTPILTIENLVDQSFINSSEITLLGKSTDPIPGIDKVFVKVDEGDWNTAQSGNNYAEWNYQWKNYAEGRHAIVAKAVDLAGNEITSTTFNVVIDYTAPTAPADFRAFNVTDVVTETYGVYLDFAASGDPTSGMKTYELYRNNTKVADISPVLESSNLNYTGNAGQSFFYLDDQAGKGKFTYKIKAIDAALNSSESTAVEIDTENQTLAQNEISELSAAPTTVVTKDKSSAIIAWKTAYPSTTLVEYGPTVKYGSKVEIPSYNQGHNILLPDLKPGTIYHAKVTNQDLYGRKTSSNDLTLTTKVATDDKTILQVIINTLQNLVRSLSGNRVKAASGAEISQLQEHGEKVLLTDVSFAEKGLYQFVITTPAGTSVSRSFDGKDYSSTNENGIFVEKSLDQAKTYYYKNGDGKSAIRKPAAGDNSPLAIEEPGIVKESIAASKEKVQMTVFWKTNRGSSSQVEFGPSLSYGQKTKEDASLNTSHYITIENFTPDTLYHFRVTSKDTSGQSVVSNDFTFKTPSQTKEKSIIDYMVESLQRVLGLFGVRR